MRAKQMVRVFSVLILCAVLLGAAANVAAAPAPQAAGRTISVDGYVDVSGDAGLACPGCNLVFDAADRDASKLDPLPSFTVIVRDVADQELARGTTSLTSGASATLQQLQLTVPEAAEYRVILDGAPAGWELCPNQQAVITLTEDDFRLNRALVSFFFWKGCAGLPTPMPTATGAVMPSPTVTVGPGTPTLTPGPLPTLGPTREPARPAPEVGRPHVALGSIRGLAYIDLNGDGQLAPDEPGLNDVAVHLRGGGLDLVQITPGTGQYSFDGLGVGEYDVFIDPGPEWQVTTPKLYKIRVSGGTVMGYDFGLRRVGAPLLEAPVAPGAGVRLPATGVMSLRPSTMLGVATVLFGALAVLGMALERRRWRR